MLDKPSCRQPRNLLELARFFEQMGRPGDDFEAFLSAKFCEGFAVPREHLTIGFSDDEERWCGNFRSTPAAMSVRLPRQTIARIAWGRSTAATSAAAPPVLAPK